MMPDVTRRTFLKQSGIMAGSAALSALLPDSVLATAKKPGSKGESEPELTLLEDLMHEHGLLNRLLLIYEACQRNLQELPEMSISVIKENADIVRSFIEDYHEKLEEQYLFSRFEKAHVLVDLVHTLKSQHDAGRQVTAAILENANRWPGTDTRESLLQSISAFITMYRPHEAREDTVLFPTFKTIVSPHEYAELGEVFEDIETEKFGKNGFEHVLSRVETLEKTMGIYDLAQFTPKAAG